MLRLLDRPLTADDLRESTARVAQPRAPAKLNVASLLLFRAGGERLAVPAVQVARVTRVSVVRRIPHRSNSVIRGSCNINGELLLCGSLVELLQLAAAREPGDDGAPEDLRRMVVLGPESNRWVTEVDEVAGVRYFETDSYKAPPVTVGQARNRFTVSLVPLSEGGVATLLDVPQVLSGFKAALA
jgi:chemotaxis signal transduction protein